MSFLDTLTQENILQRSLPIQDILKNSFYYPSSGLDGRVVKWYSHHIQSFVYCDYAIGEDRFLAEMANFKGYSILAQRSVRQEELVPNGWYPTLPRGVSMKDYAKYRSSMAEPFCRWVVYERDSELDDTHGSKRFSLLFIGGEGVATYQALYYTNRTTAKAIGIIRPGSGFGLNWTRFEDEGAPLHQVLIQNHYGAPELILLSARNLAWPGYELIDTIQTHDRFTGDITIWKKHKEN